MYFPYYPKNCKYNKRIAAALIMRRATNPNTFEVLLFTCSPIISLLLEMCNMIAMSTGAVIPYKIAV
jgi:hypothetical protein